MSFYLIFSRKYNEDYKQQIARLNQEIGRLEDIRASDKQIIKMLEKELEKTQNTKQQE